MNEWLMIAIIVMVIALVLSGWHFYDARVGKPRSRRKALENSLATLADHNVDIEYVGTSKRIEQAKFLKNGHRAPISVLDLLNRDSALNESGDWKKLKFHEGFHQGPFDDELSDDEWQFVHRRYAELVEEKTSHRVAVETHQRFLKESEERINRLSRSYVEQAREIAQHAAEHDSDRWNEEFDALNDGERG